MYRRASFLQMLAVKVPLGLLMCIREEKDIYPCKLSLMVLRMLKMTKCWLIWLILTSKNAINFLFCCGPIKVISHHKFVLWKCESICWQFGHPLQDKGGNALETSQQYDTNFCFGYIHHIFCMQKINWLYAHVTFLVLLVLYLFMFLQLSL